MTAHGRDLHVGNVLQGIRHPCVLCDAAVVVVHLACALVEDHILQQRAKADRIPNLRLLLTCEADGLGIATALNVEDTLVCPGMLVVADQQAILICGQRGLSRSTEAEENGHIAGLALVGAGVHAQNSTLGQQVVHDGENTFLHLPSILRAQNHHLSGLEVQTHRGPGGHAIGGTVRRKGAAVVDGVVRLAEVQQFLLGRSDEHVVHEECMVRSAGDDSNLVAEVRVPPSEAIEHV
mmetsp:Transcript_5437/g.12488  ORF Transcript_5437/g.12488 Transcript_5437/m.12488 type:complete len:236 (+) Transcript_5437:615-1322(+)